MDNLEQIKKSMKKNGIDFLLVPMTDEFNNEYVPAHNRRIEFITGFTGSSAFLIIGFDKSVFFTDGRYTLQARSQVDSNIYEINDISEKTPLKWCEENIEKGEVIGFDSKIFKVFEVEKYKDKFFTKNVKILKDASNIIYDVWQDRPKFKPSEAFIFDERFSGNSAKNKIYNISNQIEADYLLITSPESVCWLLNIRGRDLKHTPILFCYAILSKKDGVTLYSYKNSITNEVERYLEGLVEFKDIEDIYEDLFKLSSAKVQIDPKNTQVIFQEHLKRANCDLIEVEDPIIIEKAVKNETELKNLQIAHKSDGAALCRFFFWLENQIEVGEEISEVEAAKRLAKFRQVGETFFSISFDSIVGFESNGAIIHYHPQEDSCAKINDEGMLLLDSGGQYFEGTTDVTRTVHFGEPSLEQIENFTLVLKGHLQIAMANFVSGTTGGNLDILARSPLLQKGKDYKHGTGHGVGFFMNVHEGPHGISRISNIALKEGMVISNEPGYYKEGEYGIRIESLVYVKKSDYDGLLSFETLTLAPIDKKLIDKSLLTAGEIDWLNHYHKRVYDELFPLLTRQEQEWLRDKTSKI